MEDRGIELLHLIDEGSERAFIEFYHLYVSFVLQIASQVIGDDLEAEDVCHDIFLEVYENPSEYNEEKGSVKAWLAVKTRNRSIDRLRKKKPLLVQKLETIDRTDVPITEMQVLKRMEQKVILDALKQLPKKQRDVIYGAYFEGKTQKELALMLNRPLGTIKSSVRYGLQNLRKYKKLKHWVSVKGE